MRNRRADSLTESQKEVRCRKEGSGREPRLRTGFGEEYEARRGSCRLKSFSPLYSGESRAFETAYFAASAGTWNTSPNLARRRTWTVPLGLQTAR